MEVDIIQDEGRDIGLVRVRGTLCSQTVDRFRGLVATMMVPGKEVKHYVMDFKQTDAVDLTVLGSLLSILKHIRAMNGDVRLACLRPEIKTELEKTKVHTAFESYATRGEAVRSYRDSLHKEE